MIVVYTRLRNGFELAFRQISTSSSSTPLLSLFPFLSSPHPLPLPARQPFFQAYISTPRARRVIKRFISVFCKICGATACEWRGERCRGKEDNEACCVGAKKVSGRCIIAFNLGPMPSIQGFLLSNPPSPAVSRGLPSSSGSAEAARRDLERAIIL